MAKDLKAAGAKALVVAGPRQPAAVQAIASLINQTLGSTCVTYTKPVIDKSNSGVDALKTLAGEMSSGQVSTLVILGGNLSGLYGSRGFCSSRVAMSKVANSIHLGPDEDETAAAAKWHVPEAHYLESWGDQATSEGLAAIQQPMIDPLYQGRTASEIVAQLVNGKPTKAHEIVKGYWTALFTEKNKDDAWKKALHDGCRLPAWRH